MTSQPLRVSALYVHPVKSCAGVRVDELTLDALGAVDDRRFMLVDAAGDFVSQRRHPQLACVSVARTAAGGVVLSAPGRAALDVPVPSASLAPRGVTIWEDTVDVRDCGDAAAAWLSAVLGIGVRLVHMASDSVRPVDPRFAPRDARTALSDGFPLLVATDASLADLADRAGAPLEMERFRPNVVLSGSAAWAEDTWDALQIGDVTLRLVKPCARCSITLVDPRTGSVGVEPLRTLARFRRGADLGYGGADAGNVYFAWNALHDSPGRLRVGDEVRAVRRC
jgi:hypothetical protein